MLDREGEGVKGERIGWADLRKPAADALPAGAGRVLGKAQSLGGGAQRVVLESHKGEELSVGRDLVEP